MKLFFGDIHNHCGITYGFGSLENALAAAREQMDFCAVIGHAMWPDMPSRSEAKDDKRMEFMIDFHEKGFAKLKASWDEIREAVAQANVPHEFVTFQGYEIHSSHYGDHHLLSPEDDLPLIEADIPADLVAKLAPRRVIAVPHHIGYTPGYRGISWDAFDSSRSPIVEVFSKHGCSMSDNSAYPYLHTMGPRDSRNTISAGLQAGHKFSFAGSTDHHAGYPGSYGDGRVAVLAKDKTREAIWEALLAGRTYAITGDKIQCSFQVNGADFGSQIKDSGTRNIDLNVEACDEIDQITIFKNTKPWKVLHGELNPQQDPAKTQTYKVRVEMGWGKRVEGYDWDGKVNIKQGNIKSVETCFRGQSVLAPSPEMQEDPDINKLGNHLMEQTNDQVSWTCRTYKNPSTQHSATAAIILELKGNEDTELIVELNGKKAQVTIAELNKGSLSYQTLEHISEAFLIHRPVLKEQYSFSGAYTDTEKKTEHDFYHVEVRQKNNQFAWISPVFLND